MMVKTGMKQKSMFRQCRLRALHLQIYWTLEEGYKGILLFLTAVLTSPQPLSIFYCFLQFNAELQDTGSGVRLEVPCTYTLED